MLLKQEKQKREVPKILPTFRRFSSADVPTAPNWISNIFGPLNLFCEQTVLTLNKNLLIGSNVQGQMHSTKFTTLSSYALGNFTPIVFQYTGGGQPSNALIGQISRSDGVMITSAVMISDWFLNINTSPATVTIRYIAGLDASKTYNVNLLVL